MEDKKRNVIKVRRPKSVPLYGRLICSIVPTADIYSESGIIVSVKQQDLIVVAVSSKVEDENLKPGCVVIPFSPPTHDGGRTELSFQGLVEHDEKGRHEYCIVYESELASYTPVGEMIYDIEVVEPKDFVIVPKSNIIIPKPPAIIKPEKLNN
jgi:hypothetical protein